MFDSVETRCTTPYKRMHRSTDTQRIALLAVAAAMALAIWLFVSYKRLSSSCPLSLHRILPNLSIVFSDDFTR